MPGPLPRWFDRVRLPVSSPVTSAFPKSPLGRLYHDIPLNDFRAGRSYAAAVIRLSPGLRVCLPPRSSPPLHRISMQGGRSVYIRANRGSLPPRASDILAVRIGQLTAEVFHLLDLRP